MSNGKMIALVSPPSRTNTQRMPLGLMFLSSSLSRSGIRNVIIDIKSDKDAFQNTVAEFKKHFFEAAGITCCATEIFEIKDLCEAIKKYSPKTKIILGGPHPTVRPEHFEGVPYDCLVRGEGEEVLVEIMQKIKNGESLKKTYRCFCPPDLNSLPMPAYDKIDVEYYARPSVWGIRFVYLSALGLLTSRGCPYKCKFCVAHAVSGRKVRRLSPENWIKTVKYLLDTYGIDGMFFFDEVFTVNKKWVREVCRLINENNIDMLWGCQTRTDLIDLDLMKTMKRTGCIQIDVGHESGSQKMLDIMNKRNTVTANLRFAKNCRKVGLRHLANMMINLPGETLKDIGKSIDFVKRIKPHVTLWAPYRAIPGVAFGKEMTLDDLQEFTSEMLENKYKFGDYKDSLQSILSGIHKVFPYPLALKITPNPLYWWRWVRYFSYLFSVRYWVKVLKSQRRRQYFSKKQILRQKVMK